MKEISFPAKLQYRSLIARSSKSAVPWTGSLATKAKNKSLVGLMSDLNADNRREDLVWLALVLSAVALMVLNLW